MKSLNKEMDLHEINTLIREFSKNTDTMEMKSETVSDSLDSILNDDESEEETEKLTNQILDELGLQTIMALEDPKIQMKKNEEVKTDSVQVDANNI
jgi:response regulator of citrate/malate metabolism